MVVQHNLPAMNSHRQLAVNNNQTAANLEKLSSGFRINKAGDDAAGLAISEKMRGQIRGLDMATTNAENGVSLIQTAEGGLNETHAILQRMRELSVQSANGTYHDDVDRENIDKEVQALKGEIDRISSSTAYNGIKLLDGSLGGEKIENMEAADVTSALTDIGLENMGDITLTTANGTKALEGQSAKVIVSSTVDANGARENVVTLQIGDKVYSQGTPPASSPSGKTSKNLDGTAATTQPAATDFGYWSKNEAGYDSWTTVATMSGTFNDTGATKSGVVDIHEMGKQSVATDLEGGKNRIATDDAELTFQIGANGAADQEVGLHVDNMSSGRLGNDKQVAEKLEGNRVKDVDVSTREKANESIKILEASINQVSGTRADLGALQNRLEHTITNLGVTKENLQAAESSIRDVDMAKEMMDFTKNNILSQAAQSMLSQSNQLPQGVLQLLR